MGRLMELKGREDFRFTSHQNMRARCNSVQLYFNFKFKFSIEMVHFFESNMLFLFGF